MRLTLLFKQIDDWIKVEKMKSITRVQGSIARKDE
jgi:hypothetical protein